MHHFFSRLSVVTICSVLTALFVGCAKAPDEELTAARSAFKAAQDTDAEHYMPNNFSNLKKAMEAAEGEVALQNSKFALSRNYTKAKMFLKNTTTLAVQITTDVPGAKEAMRMEVEKGLASIQKNTKAMRGEIKRASKAKDKKTIAQMTTDLEKAEELSGLAAADFAASDIIEAAKKIAEGQGLLKKINDKLSGGTYDGLM